MKPEKSITESIEKDITVKILRRDYTPGAPLETVRKLAQLYNVTVPTVQRVIARLEGKGLVSARQSSGVYVNDPSKTGGFEILPDWFELLADEPEAAAALLADILEIRRTTGMVLLEKHFDKIIQIAPQTVGLLQQLKLAQTTEEIAQIDLEITALIVDATGHIAYSIVFNSILKLVYQVPYLLLAMYGDAEYTLNNLEKTFMLFTGANDPADVARFYVDLLEDVDARTVRRFRDLLLRAQSEPVSGQIV